MALLEIKNVTRRFGDFTAVDGVSLAIEAGEFFTLLGPSGCGKTTLLRMIAGFDLPDGGSIFLDGVDLADRPPEARPVRTVFQSYALFPHMTVDGNVAFPLQMAKTPEREIAGKVAAALEDVRLVGFGKRYPHEFSGGQKQRVAIARALVTHPTVLLLDEPLAALDAKLREEMQIELINMQKEVGITFVYVTHDQTEALALSHRIAVMNAGASSSWTSRRESTVSRARASSPISSAIAICCRARSPPTPGAWSPSTSPDWGRCASPRRRLWRRENRRPSRCAPRRSGSRPPRPRTRRTIISAAPSPSFSTWAT